MKFAAAVLVVACIATVAKALPLSRSRGVFINSDNIRSLATYLDHSITMYDRYMHVGTGSSSEVLIRVPLAEPGELDSDVTIRLTATFDPDTALTSDHDIRVGIYDGSYYNQFYVYDTSSSYVCAPYSGYHESNGVSQDYKTGHLTMYFHPFHKFGSCESGHDGGYVNVATFNSQVDPTKGLELLVNRDTYNEQYRIYYFTVEIL